MAFFRIKKIKGKEYVYSVENSWGKRGSRQKVKGYIGKAIRPEAKQETDFNAVLQISDVQQYLNNTKEKIVNDLINFELIKFPSGTFFDMENKKILNNGKGVVMLINEGYLCSLTVKNLLEFKPSGDEQEDGYRLARAFVEAGIKVPENIFIALFEKFTKNA